LFAGAYRSDAVKRSHAPALNVSLGPDFDPMMELVTGTFARRGERTAFDGSHPLNLLWQAFADEVASGDPYSL
jgi:hypothetical protein